MNIALGGKWHDEKAAYGMADEVESLYWCTVCLYLNQTENYFFR